LFAAGWFEVAVTDDGGRTWKRQDVPVPDGFEDSYIRVDAPLFFSREDGFMTASADNGSASAPEYTYWLYVTHDGGQTWGYLGMGQPDAVFQWRYTVGLDYNGQVTRTLKSVVYEGETWNFSGSKWSIVEP